MKLAVFAVALLHVIFSIQCSSANYAGGTCLQPNEFLTGCNRHRWLPLAQLNLSSPGCFVPDFGFRDPQGSNVIPCRVNGAKTAVGTFDLQRRACLIPTPKQVFIVTQGVEVLVIPGGLCNHISTYTLTGVTANTNLPPGKRFVTALENNQGKLLPAFGQGPGGQVSVGAVGMAANGKLPTAIFPGGNNTSFQLQNYLLLECREVTVQPPVARQGQAMSTTEPPFAPWSLAAVDHGISRFHEMPSTSQNPIVSPPTNQPTRAPATGAYNHNDHSQHGITSESNFDHHSHSVATYDGNRHSEMHTFQDEQAVDNYLNNQHAGHTGATQHLSPGGSEDHSHDSHQNYQSAHSHSHYPAEEQSHFAMDGGYFYD